MIESAYRSSTASAQETLERLRAEREGQEYRRAYRLASGVVAVRIARAVAGAVGTAVAISAFAVSFVCMGITNKAPMWEGPVVLFAGWPLAALAGIAAYLVAVRSLPRVPPPLAPDPASLESLERLERDDPLRAMRARASHWEFAAALSPLVALSFLAPLTLHALFAFGASRILWPPTQRLTVDGFGVWMSLVLMATTHAHLLLAVVSALWVRSFRRRQALEVRVHVGRICVKALAASVGASLVPWAACWIAALATLILFVPAMYIVTAMVLVRERGRLEVASAPAGGQPVLSSEAMKERIAQLREERSRPDYVADFRAARRGAAWTVGSVVASGLATLVVGVWSPFFWRIGGERSLTEALGLGVTVPLAIGWHLWLLTVPFARICAGPWVAPPLPPLHASPVHPSTELALLEDTGEQLRAMRSTASRLELPASLLPLVPLALATAPALVVACLIRDDPGTHAMVLTLAGVGLLHLALAVAGLLAFRRARSKPRQPLSPLLPAWWSHAFRWAVVAGVIPAVAGVILTVFMRSHARM
jgi:hypothetical protein